MDLLGIASIRRGPSGNPQAPDAANFDESKATPYPGLPDPLVFKDGTPVKTADAWWQKRRAEIVEDFDREIYGRMPAQTPGVKWEIVSTTEEMNGDVPIVTKKLLGHVDNSVYPLDQRRYRSHAEHAGQSQGPRAGDDGVRLRLAGRADATRVTATAAGADLAAAGARQRLGLRDPYSNERAG